LGNGLICRLFRLASDLRIPASQTEPDELGRDIPVLYLTKGRSAGLFAAISERIIMSRPGGGAAGGTTSKKGAS